MYYFCSFFLQQLKVPVLTIGQRLSGLDQSLVTIEDLIDRLKLAGLVHHSLQIIIILPVFLHVSLHLVARLPHIMQFLLQFVDLTKKDRQS